MVPLLRNPSAQSLYWAATRGAWIGLAANLALAIGKSAAGLASGSFALLSDAVNSLGDTLSSIVTMLALRYAQTPADAEHPYGHTRAEAVAGAYVALLIIVSGLGLGWEALKRLGADDVAMPPAWTLLVAAGNVVAKEGLYWYHRGVARRTGSMALVANAWDHRSDAMCSLAVFVGLALQRWGGPGFAWADTAAGLAVVLAILWSGSYVLKQSTSELLDPQADEELVARVRQQAEQVVGVRAVEKLWVRKTGIEYLVDIHIQVDPQMSVEAGHRISHAVQRRLETNVGRVKGVLVHLEPYYPAADPGR